MSTPIITNEELAARIDTVANDVTTLTGRTWPVTTSDPITNTNLDNRLITLESQLTALQTENNILKAQVTALIPKVDAIEADAVGSWVLDKASGIMTLYSTEGLVMAKFKITETEEETIKERRTDLEVAV